MNNKTKHTYVVVAILGLIIAVPTYAMGGNGAGKGNSSGQGQNRGTNFIDENENGIADGQEDFDGDGILNKDDDNYERGYVNMQDTDGDGVANSVDEDYEPARDGSNRPETTGNGQVMKQNGSQVGQGQNNGNVVKNNVQNRNQNRVNNNGIGDQIHVIAQEQARLQEGIAGDVAKLQEQNSFQRMMFGADEKNVKKAQEQLGQYNGRIAQLKKMSESETAVGNKAMIDAQISEMKKTSVQLNNQIEKNDSLGLFGWIKNLFN